MPGATEYLGGKPAESKKGKKVFLALFATLLVVAAVVGIVAGVNSRKSQNNGDLITDPTTHAILKSSCSITRFPELCYSAVAAGGSKKVSSQKDVIEASVNLTITAVEHSYFTVSKLYKTRKGLTKREKAALHDCLENIDETLDELHEVQEDLEDYPNKKSLTQHADDLKTLLSSAMTNQETCLDGFSHDKADQHVREALLKGEIHIEQMCSNVLAMIKNMTDTDIATERMRVTGTVNGRKLREDHDFTAVDEHGWPQWLSAADRRLLQSSSVTPDVVVAADGSGNFKTISEAVKAAPDNSKTRYVIRIKAGVYRENVDVSKKKKNIMFLGDGRENTIITASRNVVDGSTTFNSATVGKDVTQMVHNFLANGEFEEGCADANIVLIPKNKKPENMTQLRPIALCNVSYKIITKVVVNRMKPFMDRVVSENQSAFIPGRLISDNVLISFEVLHYLKRKRKGKDGFMALKLDMSKAYDRIEWNFLEAMLRKLGFENWWTRRLVKCVSSACYTVIHGKHEIGPIIPSRGIRQGDPLSPYLFILCAEGLSAILRRYEARGLLHGCKVANGAPRISHMLFADDSYLYCKATMEETTRVQEVLSKFEEASGQKVNYSKSSIFFSTNTTLATRNNISQRLGMTIAGTNSLYLGLPSTISRNKTAVFGYLKERVRKRIEGWETKFLSRAGKEILIKTVAQSLPSYAMSVFLIPIDITREMEKIMTKFWWQSSNKSGKGIHWLSWDRLCTHKKQGGMGFRHLRDFNLSLLGKQGWRLLVQPDSLVAKIFKARYYPNNSYLDASLGNNPSFVWRSVWEAQQLVRKGLRWCVGDGTEINVLHEPWLPCSDNPYVSTSYPSLIDAKVHSLMKMNDTGWDMEILEDIFEERDRRLIVQIPLQQSAAKDKLTWAYEASGIYSVKSAYKLLQQVNGRWDNDVDAASAFWTTMWRLKIPPKVKNTLWRAGKNCLPTLCMLQTKRVNVNSLCPICREEEETILHALVTCSHIKPVWDRVGIGTNITPDITLFLDWCIRVFTGADASKRCLIATLCWAIWSSRNDFVWQKKVVNADGIVVLARGYLDQWTNAQSTLIESSWSGFQTGDGVEQWSAPSENSIKINVDAALFEDGTSHGIGMVARDHHGFLIEGRTDHFQGAATPEIAEAIGVREALSWIKQKNWQQASIETDCLMVVQAIRSSTKMLSLFGQIIDECKRLSSELKHVSIFFVKRSANVVAHNFARASILFPGCLFGMESVPTDLLHCLVTEIVG